MQTECAVPAVEKGLAVTDTESTFFVKAANSVPDDLGVSTAHKLLDGYIRKNRTAPLSYAINMELVVRAKILDVALTASEVRSLVARRRSDIVKFTPRVRRGRFLEGA